MNDTQFQALMGSLINANAKLENIYAALFEKMSKQQGLMAVQAMQLDQLRNELSDVKAMQAVILKHVYVEDI